VTSGRVSTRVRRRRSEAARFGASGAVASVVVVAGWSLAQRPELLPGLRVEEAAAGRPTLIAIVGVAVGGLVSFRRWGRSSASSSAGASTARLAPAAPGRRRPAGAARISPLRLAPALGGWSGSSSCSPSTEGCSSPLGSRRCAHSSRSAGSRSSLPQSSRIVRSSWWSRFGSARKSSSTILPCRTVTAAIENGCPWRKATAPATPLISAGRMSSPSWA
jgi:hypothetical protein